jgi:TRAP-type C4-dicarboxylate transport system permease small subunit
MVDRLPPRWQTVAHVVSYLLVGALSLVMIFEGFRWVFSSGARAQILPIPMWIPLSLVPLGGVVILIVVIAKIAIELGGPEQ